MDDIYALHLSFVFSLSIPLFFSHSHTHTLTQMSDPCGPNPALGVREFTFTLTINTLDDTTTGFYTAMFTNPGGEVSVSPTFVTPRSELLHVIQNSVCQLAIN